MNILIIPSWYPTNEKPLAGIFFKEQAENLAELGIDVTVAYYNAINPIKILSKQTRSKTGLEIFTQNNVKTYIYSKYNIPPRCPIVLEKQFYAHIDKIIKMILKEKKIDLIHVHSMVTAGNPVLKISKKYKIPFVLTEHSSYFLQKNMKKSKTNKYKKILYNSKLNIAVGKDLADSLFEISKLPITILPNIVDTKKIQTFNFRKRQTNDTVFFSAGNLIKGKKFDILIKAFSLKFKNKKNIKLKIAGKGCQKEFLTSLIVELGITDQIMLLGELPREMIYKEMNKCDVFVLASELETFGIVLIEALSCGKPIIASEAVKNTNIVTDANGILFKKNNIEDLGKKLNYMYENFKTFDSEFIKKECYFKFDKKSVCEKLINYYTKILN